MLLLSSGYAHDLKFSALALSPSLSFSLWGQGREKRRCARSFAADSAPRVLFPRSVSLGKKAEDESWEEQLKKNQGISWLHTMCLQ